MALRGSLCTIYVKLLGDSRMKVKVRARKDTSWSRSSTSKMLLSLPTTMKK